MRLARVEAINLAHAPLKGAAQILVGEATVSMPLAGIIDMDAERARLAKERDKAVKEIARIEGKLGNQQFMAKAPEEVVAEQRERLAEATQLRDRIDAALAGWRTDGLSAGRARRGDAPAWCNPAACGAMIDP